jgi:hypothetical protein
MVLIFLFARIKLTSLSFSAGRVPLEATESGVDVQEDPMKELET